MVQFEETEPLIWVMFDPDNNRYYEVEASFSSLYTLKYRHKKVAEYYRELKL